MLKPQKYTNFTTNEIKAKGWLLNQLKVQENSLSGNLDKIWPDIRDSKYIGGHRDDWERVPYWLDGFIPLAYLLEDQDMIARGKKYIDSILEKQQPDGWLCVCTMEERANYDIWALFLMCKALVVYYECSNDERVVPAVYRALENLQEHIKSNPLKHWSSSRWFEALISIFWMYDRTKESWLIDLAKTISEQGLDYEIVFSNPLIQEVKKQWTQESHVVNMGMAIKADGLKSRMFKDNNAEFAEKMLNILRDYHGTAYEHFNGDECLSGPSPIQGSELCSIVEAMYSYEVLFNVTGNHAWLDRLEMLAYNALPATTSPDMWTHQYDQMTNQIACIDLKDNPIFLTNDGDSHLFGLEPNFGCCTANFNQGWPKFALSTFLKSDKGIMSAALAPASVTTAIDGVAVTVELDTQYPFRNTLNYTISVDKDVAFCLDIRIPRWVTSVKVNGNEVECEKMLSIDKTWSGTENVAVEFEFDTIFDSRPNDLVFLRRGPLLYSVNIEEKWTKKEYTLDGVERKFPYCDYEIEPQSKWNYAYWNSELTVVENKDMDLSLPFSSENPPIRILANMVEIDWGFEPGYDSICAKVPNSREPLSEVQKVVLKPYGCTNLRITEVPKLN